MFQYSHANGGGMLNPQRMGFHPHNGLAQQLVLPPSFGERLETKAVAAYLPPPVQ